MRDYSPFAAKPAATGWLSTPEQQKGAYLTLALNWAFAGFLHISVFSLLITTTVANHALFALAYGHFSLVITALLSLRHAAKNSLLRAATYRRLNVGLALSGVAGIGVLLWPSVVNLLTAGDFMLKIIPKFSNSPLAVFTTCWTVGLLLASVLIPRRVWNVTFVQGELKGLAISNAAINTLTQFFSPKTFSGAVQRISAAFIAFQLVLAVFAPSTMLSLTGASALAKSEMGLHAMKLWAASLVFQLMTALATFSSQDYLERGGTYKRLNIGFAITFALQSLIWTTASIPYASQSLQKPSVVKLTMKREPSVLTFIEDAAMEPDVAKATAEANAAAPPAAKKMTLWQEAMIKPTKFVSEEMPKLMASSNELVNNKQLMAYNLLSLGLAVFCATERIVRKVVTKSSEGAAAPAGGDATEGKSGDVLFTLAVTAFQKGDLNGAAQYLEACSQKWSADGVLAKKTAYAEALNDIADKIAAAGGPRSSTLIRATMDSAESYLKLANNCVEQAVAALEADDLEGASSWWDEAEMWYAAAEEHTKA